MSAALPFAQDLRARDRFHPRQDGAQIIDIFFPKTPKELALDLSNVTSMFYGLMLQAAADQFGPASLDRLSRELFYRLGRKKTRATCDEKADQFTLNGDARDIVTILISAIYNASPEYEFSVERYEPGLCSVQLTGVDRYYRAAVALGIVQHLTWPTLHPFFEGIRDELGIGCQIRSELLGVAGDARLHTRYVFACT